jgi:glycerate 2-kinase
MLKLVDGLKPRDLCLCLISGGGSALLPAPLNGLSLQEKIDLTREMSARGAPIEQMNLVRRTLSEVKGGGLARACGAGRLVSLILSDVAGDDLAAIASGPTVLRPSSSPDEALRVLRSLELIDHPAGRPAAAILQRRLQLRQWPENGPDEPTNERLTSRGCLVTNVIVGNNATAVDAAGMEAERLGYSHAMISANAPEGLAEDVAQGLVAVAQRMRRDSGGPNCLISGGEPTVRLAPASVRGRGGRNQQLCLAALAALRDWRGLALISGGTDGEDGPTDAAGACVDEYIAQEVERLGLEPAEYLARNDAYSFFERAGGLLKTGPTHTNVGDLRVLTVAR